MTLHDKEQAERTIMFPVEKSVPIPKTRNNSLYPFGQMEVGDSFFIPDAGKSTAASIRACASAFGKKNNRKFSCRQVDGGVRVWRLA